MKRLQPTYIEIDGHEIPAKVFLENRNNVRVSIGKTAAFLRMPSYYSKKQAKSQIGWFQRWVKAQFDANEQLKTRFFPKTYTTGDTIQVGERSYELIVHKEARSTSSANLKNGMIHLKMNKDLTSMQLSKSIKTLLSRVIGKDHNNINLSTRLLFAPPPVIDYVIIHELTHLIEMNHSSKFWNIVKSIMPDYKQKEKWLKKNGKFCDF